MPKRGKRVVKSKEEVIKALKDNAAFMDKIKFVKERFYPALLEASTSIEDAKQLLSGFNTQIMQEFLGEMKNRKTSELALSKMLDPNSPKYAENVALVEIFNDMSVFDAKDYIEGMRGEIAMFQQEEMENRPLSSLKTKWIDEL